MRCASTITKLDISVEISGPRGLAVRLKRVRLPRQSVHRIPHPTSVTIAKRPSWWARDGEASKGDLPDIASKNACGTLARQANQTAHPGMTGYPFGGVSGCTISENAGSASQRAAWAFNEG
jgi:hypothetical protein